MNDLMAVLPESIRLAIEPVTTVWPMDRALQSLVVDQPIGGEVAEAAIQASKDAVIRGRPELLAGLWLYVDDLERSHQISQSIQTPTGSYWHAIMHRREGDFWNSGYWLRQAGQHPVWSVTAGYDVFRFLKEVEQSHTTNPSGLVALQRLEWVTLMAWCARQDQ